MIDTADPVTLTITGTMGSAGCIYQLINDDKYDVDYGAWLEPVTVRNIPRNEAVALGELLLTESDGLIKYNIEEK